MGGGASKASAETGKDAYKTIETAAKMVKNDPQRIATASLDAASKASTGGMAFDPWTGIVTASLESADSLHRKYTSLPDPDLVERIEQETERLCQRWKRRDFAIRDVKIYTRAVKGRSRSAGAEGAIGGLCHTFIILETESDTYILERLEEGVKLANLGDTLPQSIKRSAMIRRSTAPISSAQIATWTQKEAKQPYGLGTNNCINFAFKFGTHFVSQRGNGEGWYGSITSFARSAWKKAKRRVEKMKNL